MTANKADAAMPKRTSLPSDVAAGKAERVERVVAVRFRRVANDDAGDEEHAHDREHGPALPLVADHAAEDVGQRSAERKDRDHLHIVGKGGRIFERMRGIGVEEAAAICAEHLDRDLRGNRPDRDGLLGPFHCRRIHVRAKCLRHALPDQEQRVGHADGDEDVERNAGDIDPKIADGAHRVPREAADERDGEHDASRRRKEVLVREAEHLHEVGHRAFAAVVLPVGVGDEAHRRIERQVGRNRRLFSRVEGQSRLQAHQHIKNEKSADVEQQHADRVCHRMLFMPLVDAGSPVDHGFDRPQERRKKGAFAAEHARHIGAERRHDSNDDRAIEQNLDPADNGHGRAPFRTARA